MYVCILWCRRQQQHAPPMRKFSSYITALYRMSMLCVSEKALTLFAYNNRAYTHTYTHPARNFFFFSIRSLLLHCYSLKLEFAFTFFCCFLFCVCLFSLLYYWLASYFGVVAFKVYSFSTVSWWFFSLKLFFIIFCFYLQKKRHDGFFVVLSFKASKWM